MSTSNDIDKAKECFAADSFARKNGMELVTVSPGRATVSMQGTATDTKMKEEKLPDKKILSGYIR